MSQFFELLIVGGGHAGAQVASGARQFGFEATIAIIGEETELPYDRPPLSKEYLAGEKPWERLPFKDAAKWAQLGVSLLGGQRITRIDPDTHLVQNADGETFGYGKLVWATGGDARKPPCPGGDAGGVHTIRNRADIDRIISALPSTREVVVIGGGYIGLEAAAVLTKLGKRVTLVEALDRVLSRVAGERLSRFFEHEHRDHGVDLRLGASVAAIEVEAGRAVAVRLADGSELPSDMVIAGIGIVPAIIPVAEAGAEIGNGVRVDAHCRTTLPDIFAAGDCAEQRSPFAGGAWTRIESVQNANDQAMAIARAIAGKDAREPTAPWFWSNQYDLRLQTVGLSLGFDACVVRGDPAERAFSLVYLKEGRVIALDCVNATRDYVQGKRLVELGAIVPHSDLKDVDVPLKALISA